jgi:hypothetical protein
MLDLKDLKYPITDILCECGRLCKIMDNTYSIDYKREPVYDAGGVCVYQSRKGVENNLKVKFLCQNCETIYTLTLNKEIN